MRRWRKVSLENKDSCKVHFSKQNKNILEEVSDFLVMIKFSIQKKGDFLKNRFRIQDLPPVFEFISHLRD